MPLKITIRTFLHKKKKKKRQEITYHVNNSMEKTETAIIIEKKTEGFNANMNDSKNVHVNLLLPSIPPSDTILSSVCKVCYVLRVKSSQTIFVQFNFLFLWN